MGFIRGHLGQPIASTAVIAPMSRDFVTRLAALGDAHDIPRVDLPGGNPEIIEWVRESWGVTIRDGYGQTETTVQIANTPGQLVKPGSMGRPMPGYGWRYWTPPPASPSPRHCRQRMSSGYCVMM